MDHRNELFRRSVDYINKKAVNATLRDDKLRQLRATLVTVGKAAGQGQATNSLAVSLDACNDVHVRCDPNDEFRTIDGRCNNVDNPFWGAAGVAFRRFLPAEYCEELDGRCVAAVEGERSLFTLGPLQTSGDTTTGSSSSSTSAFKCSSLPSPRLVSSRLHPDVDRPATSTHMLTQFGQILDHDLTLSPEAEVEECCEHPDDIACFNIDVPPTDPFYSRLRTPVTCLPFPRSTSFCIEKLKGSCEQMNVLTSFVDASFVYGSDDHTAHELRAHRDGLMAVSFTRSGAELLPLLTDDHGEPNFAAGDIRSREMPGLTAMHTLFVREHNRIARELKPLTGQTDDEWLYQAARRMVIAQVQNIVYDQYLEVLLGRDVLRKFGILLPDFGYTDYDATIDPTIRNAFGTAAFRYGHTMIQGLIDLNTRSGSLFTQFNVRDNFFNDKFYTIETSVGQGVELFFSGLQLQPAQALDNFITEDVSNFLFPESPGADHGEDLIARNLQRSRDHGLPGYLAFRESCGLSRDLADIQSTKVVQLVRTYGDIERIELFSAGILEEPAAGALTGPTFTCLIAKTFKFVMQGDRFFFTHRDVINQFTLSQVENLRDRHLGDMMCDNLELDFVRENVFDAFSPYESCKSRKALDLSLFYFNPHNY